MGIPTVNLDPKKITEEARAMREAGTGSVPALVTEFQNMAANAESAPKRIDPASVKVTEFANRDPEEFQTAEFKVFQANIEQSGGNNIPAAVYLLPEEEQVDGLKYGLIFGHRRLIACTQTKQLFKALIRPKPTAREQVALMTQENDDREGPAVWAKIKWVAEMSKHYDSARQYANHTGTPENTVTRFIRIAAMPDDVIDLLKSRLDIQVALADKLVSFITKNPAQFDINLEKVKGVHKANSLSFKEAVKLLTLPSEEDRKESGNGRGIRDASGQEFASYKLNRNKELRLVLKDATPGEVRKLADFIQRMR